MCRSQQELSFDWFLMPWSPPEPKNWLLPKVMLFQLWVFMLTIISVAASSTLAVMIRCSWMQCFVFASSWSAPCKGKRPWYAAALWKIALSSAVLDFWGILHQIWYLQWCTIWVVDVIAPDDADIASGAKFHCFMGGSMWLWLEWPTLSLMRWWATFKKEEKINYNCLGNESILGIQKNTLISFNLI